LIGTSNPDTAREGAKLNMTKCDVLELTV